MFFPIVFFFFGRFGGILKSAQFSEARTGFSNIDHHLDFFGSRNSRTSRTLYITLYTILIFYYPYVSLAEEENNFRFSLSPQLITYNPVIYYIIISRNTYFFYLLVVLNCFFIEHSCVFFLLWWPLENSYHRVLGKFVIYCWDIFILCCIVFYHQLFLEYT